MTDDRKEKLDWIKTWNINMNRFMFLYRWIIINYNKHGSKQCRLLFPKLLGEIPMLKRCPCDFRCKTDDQRNLLWCRLHRSKQPKWGSSNLDSTVETSKLTCYGKVLPSMAHRFGSFWYVFLIPSSTKLTLPWRTTHLWMIYPWKMLIFQFAMLNDHRVLR